MLSPDDSSRSLTADWAYRYNRLIYTARTFIHNITYILAAQYAQESTTNAQIMKPDVRYG